MDWEITTCPKRVKWSLRYDDGMNRNKNPASGSIEKKPWKISGVFSLYINFFLVYKGSIFFIENRIIINRRSLIKNVEIGLYSYTPRLYSYLILGIPNVN